ncbi:hypothetical protein MPEAHAMD_4853 [Methylobacterium frigidaeris]|uniref:Uncharacterized protein n=2 Tax=Methylobacterium frigidaeris TaxID=2038277 RepID=A0AA37HF02_9HYPH|nr:hypothetical protein MPEAHAMD_4853 [Methylobacterium frigidaeris]
MISSRMKTAAIAATGALLLSPAAPFTAQSQPLPRVAQPGIPNRAGIVLPLTSWTDRDARSPTVEREHVRAQRIIARVCTGC